MFGHRWFLKLGVLNDATLGALMTDASELLSCNYTLNQGVDEKGQAQSGVRVGDIVATYDGLPSADMVKWALDSRTYLSGSLILYDANDIPLDKLYFQDAACVGMRFSYTNEGKSSVITQIKIKPRRFTIDGFSIDQRWNNMPDLEDESSVRGSSGSLVNKLFKLAQPLSQLALDLILGDTTYEIERFDISFEQPCDFRGQPQQYVHGGAINFTIPSLPDKALNQWMLRSDMLKDGVFAFRSGDQSSPLKIEFLEAYCIRMANRTGNGKGLSTELVISANEVRMNGKWCNNNFTLL